MRFYIIMLTGRPWVLVPQQLRRSDRYRPWGLPYHLTARTKHQVPHHCMDNPPPPPHFDLVLRPVTRGISVNYLTPQPHPWAWGTESFPFQSQQPTSPPSTPDGLDLYLTQSPIPQPTRNSSSICRLLNRNGTFLHPVI